MTLDEVYERLTGVGIPVAYGRFYEKEKPALPYIAYAESNTTNFYADGKVYFHKGVCEVVLRTIEKDLALELVLEAALNGITWEKDEDYDENEQVYEIVYEFEITEV